MDESLTPLVPLDMYELHAVHIGTNQKSSDMKGFLDTFRQDGSGLHHIDIRQTDSRIRTVAKFLANYDPSRILVVSARQYGQRPARMFAEAIGAKKIVGRFIPGTLTNPRLRTYIEPEVIVVTDPAADSQALSEAVSSGLPVVILQKVHFRVHILPNIIIVACFFSQHSPILGHAASSHTVLSLRPFISFLVSL